MGVLFMGVIAAFTTLTLFAILAGTLALAVWIKKLWKELRS